MPVPDVFHRSPSDAQLIETKHPGSRRRSQLLEHLGSWVSNGERETLYVSPIEQDFH